MFVKLPPVKDARSLLFLGWSQLENTDGLCSPRARCISLAIRSSGMNSDWVLVSFLSWMKSSLPGAIFALIVSSLHHRSKQETSFPRTLASRVLIRCHQWKKVTQDLQCKETTSHESFSAIAGRCMGFVGPLCICQWVTYLNADVYCDHCWQSLDLGQ